MSNASPSTWMPIFWGDYLKDTMHLSAEEHGAYLLLIAHYWANGGAIKNDKKTIKNVCKISAKKLDNILAFFKEKDGLLSHERIDGELARAAENQEKQKARTAAATAARLAKQADVTLPNDTTLRPSTPPSPSPDTNVSLKESMSPQPKKSKSEYTPDFETFWQLYPPNGASKAEAFKAWEKAIKNGANENEITGGVSEYRDFLTATDTPTAHATTWLNQQRWTVDYRTLAIGKQRGKEPAGNAWQDAWASTADGNS